MSEILSNSTPKQYSYQQPSICPQFNSVLATMKNLINKYISMNLYTTALFYAEKCLNLKINNQISLISDNIYDLSNCLFLNKEYFKYLLSSSYKFCCAICKEFFNL